MNRFFLLILNLFLLVFACNEAFCIELKNVQKYKVELSSELLKDSCGLYPSIGSGLKFIKKLKNGDLEFVTVTDGGANIVMKEKKNVVAFCPSFSPKISKLFVTADGKAKIDSYMNISYEDRPITGFNISYYNDPMLVVDSDMHPIKKSFGLDTESISVLKDGNFIVGDEHYPSLNIIDKNGSIIKRLLAGDGLPEITKFKAYNKGFEAVTVAPNGKIYAFLQGPLDVNSETAKTAKLIRCFEIDLDNGTTKTYAYKFDYDEYKDSSKVKLSDVVAIDNRYLLIVEQGEGKAGLRNIIYKLDLKGATDISDMKLKNGKELEYGAVEDLKKIKFIKKSFLLDPRAHGWENEKLEGLAIVDKKTIAIINDNDFGVSGYKEIAVNCPDGSIEKKCYKVLQEEDENAQLSDLWIIKFDRNI